MRARHREVRLFLGLQPDAIDIAAAADACGFQVRELDPGYAQLRCGLSTSSLGEDIVVSLSAIDSGLMVDVLSESRLPIQIEDPGMNVKNTRRLLDAFKGQIHNTVVVKPVPFCVSCGYLLAGIKAHECPECGSSTHDWQLKPRPFGKNLRYAAIVALLVMGVEIVLAFSLGVLGLLPEVFSVLSKVGGVRLFLLNLLGFIAILWVAHVWKPNK